MGMVPRFQGPAHLTQLLHEYDFICHEPTAPSLPLVQLFFFRIYVRIRSRSHIAALAISFHSALVYSSTSRLRLVASLEYTKHSVAIFKMRISPLSIITCLLAAVAAQSGPTSNPPTTPPGFTATAGSSSTFTWTPTTSGTVTLTLRNGPAGDLNKGIVLACAYLHMLSLFLSCIVLINCLQLESLTPAPTLLQFPLVLLAEHIPLRFLQIATRVTQIIAMILLSKAPILFNLLAPHHLL